MKQCKRLHILRERCEGMAYALELALLFLKGLDDETCDAETLNGVIERLEHEEYENDTKLPENFTCKHS